MNKFSWQIHDYAKEHKCTYAEAYHILSDNKVTVEEYGGDGSGFEDHLGRPGEVGGSAPAGTGGGGGKDKSDKGGSKPWEKEGFKKEWVFATDKELGRELTEQEKMEKHIMTPSNAKKQELMLKTYQTSDQKNPVNSLEMYRNKDGSWVPDRAQFHNEVFEYYLSRFTPVENPTSYVMGGGGASGKSELIKNGNVTFPKNSVKIDVDELKEWIADYNMRLGTKDKTAANFVHEESSYMSKVLIDRAGKLGYNVILDGTGNGSMEGLKEKIGKLRAAGQKVIGYYATVPMELAMKRNRARAEKTGRFVHVKDLFLAHRGVSRIFPKAVEEGLFDDVILYDTFTERVPIPIASAKGKKMVIHDAKRWREFLAKGGI